MGLRLMFHFQGRFNIASTWDWSWFQLTKGRVLLLRLRFQCWLGFLFLGRFQAGFSWFLGFFSFGCTSRVLGGAQGFQGARVLTTLFQHLWLRFRF